MTYEYDQLQKLSANSDRIDLRKIGMISITKPRYISGKQMASYCRTVAAQGIIDNLASNENGLMLRNMIPRIDFLDGYGREIVDKIWIQPQNNVTYDQSDHVGYPIYRTGSESRNDRKAIFIYGVLNMKPEEPVYATRMYFKRSDVKTLDIIDLTTLKHYHNIIFLQFPILYRRNDNAEILVDLGPDARGHNDHLAILGIVCETAGGYNWG